MKRIMMLALAVCLPLFQACDGPSRATKKEIEEKAEWVCTNLHPLELSHAVDLYPESHPVYDYVVSEVVRFTERMLDEAYRELRDMGKGWDLGAERGVVAVSRVGARHGSCTLKSMEVVERGERYRVEFTRAYQKPNGDIPVQAIVDDAFEGFTEKKGKLGLVVFMFTMDVRDIVPSVVRMEEVFERAWEEQGHTPAERVVAFDMVRVRRGVWKAELGLEALYGDDLDGIKDRLRSGGGDDDGDDAGDAKRGADDEVDGDRHDAPSGGDGGAGLDEVTERVGDALDGWAEQVERMKRERQERERRAREKRERSEREKERTSERDAAKEEALQRRIEALEREVRALKRERRTRTYRNDDVDIELTF